MGKTGNIFTAVSITGMLICLGHFSYERFVAPIPANISKPLLLLAAGLLMTSTAYFGYVRRKQRLGRK